MRRIQARDVQEVIILTGIKAIFFDLGDTLVREYHVGEPVPSEPEVFPHVKEVISRLARRFTLAIISNTRTAGSGELRNILKNAELNIYFTLVLASAEEGIDKPNTEIFNRALIKLDLSAEEVLMVGNRISRDILGGNRAGIQSILIEHKGKDHHPEDKTPGMEDEKPIATAHSLLEVEKIILQLVKDY